MRAPSLRSVDWRFLLPAPQPREVRLQPDRGKKFQHLVLLGGSRDDEICVHNLALADRVSTTVEQGTAADAVIVRAEATVSIEDAMRALVPGGVFYWEIDRRRKRYLGLTPARADRRMSALGLQVTDAYWVKPGFRDCTMYLPLAARGAFDWYLKTLYRPMTPLRRVVKGGLRALSASRALASTVPCYAVVGGRGRPSGPALLEQVSRERLAGIDRLQPVVLAHGAAEWNRLAVLLFEPGSDRPSVALKFPRQATFNRGVESEHTLLRQLAWRLGPALRASIPASSLFYWDDLAVAIETCVPGASLSSRATNGAGAVEDLCLVVDWLSSFHDATILETAPAAPWLREHLINGVCRDFVATFDATSTERDLFARLARHLETANLGTLPIVWQHTDLGPWNVYRDSNRISVIDWEIARRGPGLADLLYFVTHWSTAVTGHLEGGARVRHFESLFFSSNDSTLSAAIHQGLAEYMQHAGIAPSLLPYLLVYTILEQALDRKHRFELMDDVATASSRDGNRYIDCLDVVARHLDQLLPAEVQRAA
jgi:hypothetical protein